MSDFKFDPNSTKNQGRWRLRDPKDFDKMWTTHEKDTEGVSYIYGVLKDGKYGTQAVRFNKDKWDEKKAEKWWNKNKHRFSKDWTEKDWEKWKKDQKKSKPNKITRQKALALSRKLIKELDLEYVSQSDVTIDYKWGKNFGIPVGSIRQGKEKIGDLDIIVTKQINKEYVKDRLSNIEDLTGGDKRIDFKYEYDHSYIGINLFIFLDSKTWGAALLHSSGPYIYNVRLRNRLHSNKWIVKDGKGEGWSLSQNGLINDKGKIVNTPTERDLQRILEVTERKPTER